MNSRKARAMAMYKPHSSGPERAHFHAVRCAAQTSSTGHCWAAGRSRACHGSELPGAVGGVVDASASRACSRARISSGV